ncbi:MAG TPA: PEGA domain-containing protein [Ktedonobacterales bacterium]|nr:PEGA domain-containing protein [Ktedonobacterales bacterium]
MAKGEGKAAWRLSQQASEGPFTPHKGQARSRWGSDIPNDTLNQQEPSTSDNARFPAQPRPAEQPKATKGDTAQEPELFSTVSSPPPVSFPSPRLLHDTKKGEERWERSLTWLESLDQPGEAADTAAPPTRPEKLRRITPAPGRLLAFRTSKRASALLVVLAVLLVAASIVVSVPSLRAGALSLLPSSRASTSNAAQGALVVQSNVADATVNVGSQHVAITQKGQGFWSVSVPLNPGAYTITVSAPNYSQASGSVQIKAKQTQIVTALLSLSPDTLAALTSSAHNHIAGQPLAQGAQTGEQYTGGQTASQSLTVTINYRVVSIVDKPKPSVLEPGAVTNVPITLLSGVVTPDVVFTASDGTSAGAYLPGPLPSANFLVSLNVLFDASGQPAFGLGNPAALTVTSGAGTPLTAPGGVNADLALLYALTQASLTQGSQATDFTCIGLADAVNGSSAQPDPEDGFMLGQTGSAAHYFYRWGQLWTTNSAAQSLNPDLPQASDDTLILAQSLINAQQAGQATGCK